MVSGCTGTSPAVSTARALQCSPEVKSRKAAFAANPEQQAEQPTEGMSTGKKVAIGIAVAAAACLTRGAVKTKAITGKIFGEGFFKNSNPFTKDFWKKTVIAAVKAESAPAAEAKTNQFFEALPNPPRMAKVPEVPVNEYLPSTPPASQPLRQNPEKLAPQRLLLEYKPRQPRPEINVLPAGSNAIKLPHTPVVE